MGYGLRAGRQGILDEAESHLDNEDDLVALCDKLMALPGYHERAMTTFLHHPKLWRGATRFQHADTLRFWRKRKNLPKVQAAVDPARLGGLEAAIRCYYRNEARPALQSRALSARRPRLLPCLSGGLRAAVARAGWRRSLCTSASPCVRGHSDESSRVRLELTFFPGLCFVVRQSPSDLGNLR